MRSIISTIVVLSAVSTVLSGAKYPVILLEIPDSIISYTYKGEYKKHKNMQSDSYDRQIFRSFRRNLEFCSELYCLNNDSLDIKFKKETSGKNTISVPVSGFKKNSADLIIYFQRLDITLKSTYIKPQTTMVTNGAMPGYQTTTMVTNPVSGYSTSIKLSTGISIFSIKENRLLLTKEITSTKKGSNSHEYSPKDLIFVKNATDEEIEKEGNVGGAEVEEAVKEIALKLIKNTAWEIRNKRPQKEIVE